MNSDSQEHEELLREWRGRPHHVAKAFIADGAVDFDRWNAAKRRVLFLLKEAYGDPGASTNWDLRAYLRCHVTDGLLGNTFWTVACWHYLLKRHQGSWYPRYPTAASERDTARQGMLETAVVNLKKSGGTSTSREEDLRSHVQRDADLLRRQIELLRPHVIVCGSTSAFFDALWPGTEANHDLVREIEKRKRIVVDFVHPALRGLKRQVPYHALGAIVAQVECPGEALT